MTVGFTGTRKGMTHAQKSQLCVILSILANHTANVFHQGGADGADLQAVELARHFKFDVTWHPADGHRGDAVLRANGTVDIVHDELPPLVRNYNIVRACDLLVAAPETDKEVLRSGTWATVRAARQMGKPVVMLSRGEV